MQFAESPQPSDFGTAGMPSLTVLVCTHNRAALLAKTLTSLNAAERPQDWNVNVIEGGNINEDAVRWFQTSPLSNLVNVQMRQFQDDIQMDSGQNQFTRGAGGSGLTAASAIMALQAAGGQPARMRTATLHSGFKRIAEQVLWLISQFYDDERVVRLRGVDQTVNQDREVSISQERIYGGDAPQEGEKPKKRGRKKGEALPPPPYTVRIQVQRRNPMRIQAENEMLLQMYAMAAQGGTPIPLPVIAQMLHFDGKDKILPVLIQTDQTMRQMQQLAAQNEQLQVQLQQTQEQAGQQIQQMGQQINNLKNEIAEQTKPPPAFVDGEVRRVVFSRRREVKGDRGPHAHGVPLVNLERRVIPSAGVLLLELLFELDRHRVHDVPVPHVGAQGAGKIQWLRRRERQRPAVGGPGQRVSREGR